MTRAWRNRMLQLERRELWCECGRVASYLDSSGHGECARCRELNSKVVEWHHATQQAMSMRLREAMGEQV